MSYREEIDTSRDVEYHNGNAPLFLAAFDQLSSNFSAISQHLVIDDSLRRHILKAYIQPTSMLQWYIDET